MGFGFFLGLFSSAAFGLIPFFTLPLMRVGVSAQTALVYRFAIASVITWVILKVAGEKLGVSRSDFLKLFCISFFYMLAVVTFFYAFSFLASGAVATIQFLYPLMVMLIMIGFFHEKFHWQTGLAAALAIVGVGALSCGPELAPVLDETSAKAARPPFGSDLFWGVSLSLLAGLGNALYFVGIQVAKIGRVTGLGVTFYVMAFGTGFSLVNALATNSLQWISGWRELGLVFGLALVTAVLSNLTLIMAVKRIGSTLTSILGVMEPLTAAAVGVLVFGEPFTPGFAVGVVLIVCAALTALLMDARKHKKSSGEEPEPK